MTYKEKMNKECPIIDPDFVLFSCPGHYFEDAPDCNHATCPGPKGVKCYDCWNTEIPTIIPSIPVQESTEKTLIDAKKIAARVKELYNTFRDEGLSHPEAFEITKIIISAEVNGNGRYNYPV